MTWDVRVQALALFTAFAVSGCGGGSGSSTASAPAPTATLSSSIANVPSDGSVTLTWSSTNATSCTASGSWGGSLAMSGSQSVVVTQNSTYSLSCSGSGGNATASVTVTAAPMVLAVTVQYQRPGAPVINTAGTFYVPDWAHPVVAPVPYVYVEVDDPTGQAVQATYADANGVATFTGLDPRVQYTPQIRSQINYPPLGMDFEVLNNTAPLDTSQGKFRLRYSSYSTSFPAYTPSNLVQQALTVTAPDGWDASMGKLVDANRVAAPYELLAYASFEAVTVSDAAGGLAVRPLTILWTVANKGGLAAPPDNYDQGTVTGSGGFYASGHGSINASGTDSGSNLAEDYIFLSGDQTTEAMDIYPTVMTHEMGHFAQALFSTSQSPGGNHSYNDYEDFTLAWIEGSASGISALVMNTPTQNRLAYVSGEIVVGVYDISNNTISGNHQSWPIGWYQESTTTAMMWAAYNPKGTMHLSAAATLAPMFSAAWEQGPYLNSIWAYAYLLKQDNPVVATAIDAWSAAHNIVTAGNDAWGTIETHTGNRTAQDSLPPYTTINIGQTVQVCSAGAPLEYNKESNSRYLFLKGDGASHTLSAQGPPGTVPLLSGSIFTAGSASTSQSGVVPPEGVATLVGDCSVSYSQFSSDTAACSEPVAPPAEQCWSVTWQ
jgi:hypothetical protein